MIKMKIIKERWITMLLKNNPYGIDSQQLQSENASESARIDRIENTILEMNNTLTTISSQLEAFGGEIRRLLSTAQDSNI